MTVATVLYDNARRALSQLVEVDEVAEHLSKAKAVEEYAKRAKDRSLEIQAAEYRTYCEARLGQFSVEAKRQTPGQPEKNGTELCHSSRRDVARRADVSRMHLERTSEPLAKLEEQQLEDAVETLKAEGIPPTPRKVLNMAGPLMSSSSDEWYTPEHVWRAAMGAMGLDRFDLDPCSDPGFSIAAAQHYTEADDGLSKPWRGSVWMNPPYGNIAQWCGYLRSEYDRRTVSDFAALVPARIDTAWWRALTDGDIRVVLIAGRLKFGGSENSAPFPSALVFGNVDPAAIVKHCGELGRLWVAYR